MKNRTNKREWLLGLLMIFLLIQVQAQGIDKEKMKRDLAVTENVLSTLLRDESSSPYFLRSGSKDIKGDYLEDYGVVFTIDKGMGNFAVFSSFGKKSDGFYYTPDGGFVMELGKEDAKNSQSDAKEELEEAQKTLKEQQEKDKNNFIEAAKDFLADYANLISQLKAEDRIMIRLTSGSAAPGLRWGRAVTINAQDDDFVMVHSDTPVTEEITVEAKVKDIESLKKGEIDREAFLRRVKVTEVETSEEKKADLEIISTMFKRLYERDLSDTYYTLSNVTYSLVKGVGVVYKMRVYSSFESDNVFFIPSTGDKNLNREERDKKVQELLPKFEEGFKKNLVNYGRSIKSLEAGELLIFNVQLTKCETCADFPKSLKFSIKKSVLDDFNRGTLSEKQAMDLVKVEREL